MRAGRRAHSRNASSAASTEVVMAQDEFSACRRLLSGIGFMMSSLAVLREQE